MLRTAARSLALVLPLAATSLFAQPAQQARPADAQDSAYARLVREATSDPRFLPTTVATLPGGGSVPSPRRHFGTIIGAPGVMHRTAEIYGYMRALAAASRRVRVETIGTTEEGRDILLVAIADEATIRELDRYKAAAARLADPRRVPTSEVDAAVRAAKPIYYLNAGLHSPEMGSPEMVMELAYRLAVSDDPSIRKIRERVITLINPVSEPDGRDRQVDWYYRYTKGRPRFDDGFPRSTPYWGKYVVHDNNRDGIQISQALTKAIYRAYYEWHPVVMHDLHESVPLLYVSTGTGPYNPHHDPIIISEWQLLANHDVAALTALGLPGVWTWGFFDGWWPGYAMWVANNHNSVGRFYETFGNAGADTYVRDLSNARYAGESVTSQQWYRAWPPTKRVRWSARDNVNYMQAGVLASLEFAADNAEQLLRNFWRKGLNSMTRGREQKPHAYVIPALAKQRDPRRAAYLVNQLRRHGIEVQRRTAGDSAGDFVVLLNQPYRDLAVTLLSAQRFPQNAQHPPYDDIAWTLGYLYGADVKAVDDTAVFGWRGLESLRDTVAVASAVRGGGRVHVIAYHGQSELLPALYWLRGREPGARASALEDRAVAGRDTLPAGSVVIEGASADAARELAARFALPVTAQPAAPTAPTHSLDLPRVAMYHTWFDTQDEGWARYTFEQLGVPFTSIDKDDVRRGRLRQRFDVIVVPSVRGDLQRIVHGHDRKWGPMPFQRTRETPAMGTPAATADMTGGMGFEGLAELQRFVDDGGTLITLGAATRLVGESGLARELSPLTPRTLFHPGSVVRVRARAPRSPILYGFPEVAHVFRGNGPLFQVDARDSALIVLQYGARRRPEERDEGPMLGIRVEPAARPGAAETPAPDSARAASARGASSDGDYVLSGMVRGQDEIIGQGAIFDIPVRRGRVIAFTFNPLHRFLNHHEFPMVWNAILHWNDKPGATPRAVEVSGGG
ncbi:MAG: M14 family zinc carboxypeptidase [Gemmatimonadaceae bacterium]